MATCDPVRKRTELSVIVPARNEEVSLADCLRSLVAQLEARFEILVVDDGSTDRTRQIALGFPQVRLIDAPPLRPGWTGKNNAAAVGAREACGDWLLFTDADTVHRPGSLASGIEEAKQHQAALLSYSPQQAVEGFWETAVMAVIFAELASRYPPSEISNPASPAAAANGQYLLVSREAYQAVGGHGAIADSLLEDVALAQAIKRSGRAIFFRYGPDRVSTRMYRSFGQLREGWTKNLVLLFPSPMSLASRRSLEFILLIAGPLCAAGAVRASRPYLAALGLSATILLYFSFLERIRQAHFSWRGNLWALFGLPVFSYLLLRSRACHSKTSIVWKGRTYTVKAPRAPLAARDSKISPQRREEKSRPASRARQEQGEPWSI